MKIPTLNLMVCLSLLAGSVYAADPSICNPDADSAFHANGTLQSCDLKKVYE